jgi:hypothetical protein
MVLNLKDCKGVVIKFMEIEKNLIKDCAKFVID